MTNFLLGAILGFLICVWAVGATPSSAFSALWSRIEQVQEISAATHRGPDTNRQHERIGQTNQTPAEPMSYR